ncbi:MAG: HlyC/CorC family transporter [Caldilineales bacterium]|nr:HlyC/CorC family transporter [Caldilineales bacterium]
MDVPLGVGIVVLVISLALVVIVSLAGVSFGNVGRSRIRELGENGKGAAATLAGLLKNADQFLAGLLALRTLAIGASAAAAAWLCYYLSLTAGQFVVAMLVWAVAVILLQAFSRMRAANNPETVALRVAWVVRVLLILISPLSWLALKVTDSRPMGGASSRNVLLSDDGLRLLLNVGEEEHRIEADERQMINSIIRIGETTVEEVMVPRVDVVALDVNVEFQEALAVTVNAGHSRIPVYEDNVDKVIGVLYAKDLLNCFMQGKTDMALRDIVRTPYFVPESAMVNDLLGDLQHKKTHLAVVVDEYGGTAGIVTIEDLLEEIVGEIQDEYDSEAPMLQPAGPGLYLVNGRVDIDDLNREFDIQLADEDESYTLAGIIYSHLQRVPDAGDTLEIDGVRIEVVEVTDNRIDLVRLQVQGDGNDSGQTLSLEAAS